MDVSVDKWHRNGPSENLSLSYRHWPNHDRLRHRSLRMKKILLVIGDAAEVLDTMYPLFRLREDGWQVDVAGPEKRVYHLVQHDVAPDWDITVESPGYRLAADIAFRDA